MPHTRKRNQFTRHFIPKPKKLSCIIFKNRNHHNCCHNNIAWVRWETFLWYYGVTQKTQGRQKMVIDKETTVQTTIHPLLRLYYKTGDDYWLQETWKKAES